MTTELAAAEAEAAAAQAKVQTIARDERIAAEAAAIEAAGATGLKALVDNANDLVSAHDRAIAGAWRIFAQAVRDGDWPAVRGGFVAWNAARLEAAVTIEAVAKARADLAQKGLMGPGPESYRGWASRYPSVSFTAALDLAMAGVAGSISWDAIAEHPRFVEPAAPG